MTSARSSLSISLLLIRVPGRDSLEVALPLLEGRVACVGIALRAEDVHEISLASLRAADIEEYQVAPWCARSPS
jgi:hypothetical protein